MRILETPDWAFYCLDYHRLIADVINFIPNRSLYVSFAEIILASLRFELRQALCLAWKYMVSYCYSATVK